MGIELYLFALAIVKRNLYNFESFKLTRPSTTEEFIAKSKKANRTFGEYSYENVDYVNNHTKVDITCKVHGSFLQTPADHVAGKGCHKCYYDGDTVGGQLSLEKFISRSRLKHNNFYDYSVSKVIGTHKQVNIICPVHGLFSQEVANHMGGKGCFRCMESGYNKSKPGILYILKSGDITKVGITNRELDRRVKEIVKRSSKNFEVKFFTRFENGAAADFVESQLLKYLKTSNKGVGEKFCGSTECFIGVDYSMLISKLMASTQQFYNKE